MRGGKKDEGSSEIGRHGRPALFVPVLPPPATYMGDTGELWLGPGPLPPGARAPIRNERPRPL